MWKSAVLLAAVGYLGGCQAATRATKPAPLDSEGEAWVYLEPLPSGAERLGFTVESVSLVRSGGDEVLLGLAQVEFAGRDARSQRLVARGRAAPGEYRGIAVRLRNAALSLPEGGVATLLLPSEPVRVDLPFSLGRGRARVLSLTLDFGRSLDKGFGFHPVFRASEPPMPLPELLGFASCTDSDSIVVFDKGTLGVAAVLPTGRDPGGMAVDRNTGRLYVTLAGTDEVAAHDLVSGVEVGRVHLQPGDRPREILLAGDRRTLVVSAPGSNSVVLVDAAGLVETGRVRTGIQPTGLLLDRGGRKVYALNQGSNSISVVDLGTRVVVGTIPTEGSPTRAALNRTGDRLHVISTGSPYMSILAVPAYASLNRVFVGFAASFVLVDPRTDYVYVGMGDVGEIQVFPPLTNIPTFRVELRAPAGWMSIDDAFDRLLIALPSLPGVAGMELASRKVAPALDTGTQPFQVVTVGERR